jgi:sodium transport system ATP-binding protein
VTPKPSAEPAIVVERLSRTLGGVPAVRDVSFRAEAGEVFGLLGPNGAGKTTTLRILAGLLAPGGGQVQVCGLRYPEDLPRIQRQVGFLTGGMQLYGSFTPVESLRFFGRLRGIPGARLEERIETLVHEFRLEAFARRRFSSLSSGERQRASIANAILHEPSVLILDEVTVSLDVISTSLILEFVARERERGRCVVFSTHILGEAEALCDRITLLHEGRAVESGTPREIIARQGARHLTEAFLAAVGHRVGQESAPGQPPERARRSRR